MARAACPEIPVTDQDRSSKAERDEILKLLEPLFAEAEREGKWFKFLDAEALIVFTPAELRAIHKLGQMVFGPKYWVLIAPIGNRHDTLQ